MTLKFYCRPLPGSESLGPLLATASIPRLKADQIDARDYSTVERFSPDTTPYLEYFPEWKTELDLFYQTFEKELNRYRTVMHHQPLRPWSRLAFEQIAKYGLSLIHI